MGSFWTELKRRDVHRVALGYLAGAWLLIQIADTVFPRVGLDESHITAVITLLAIGFVPALILAWIFEWTREGVQRETLSTETAPRRSFKRLDRAIMMTLIVAVAYFAVDEWVIEPDQVTIADQSIVVLPFLNMSADPEQEFFADGITEEILNVLAGIPELRVISRSTAWLFKGKEIDVTDVRKRLDVSHILEGSVRRAGERIRITVQLIDARTDTHLWSDTYDRTFDDIFRIQDEISAHVASELKLQLLDTPSSVVEIDSYAYELYMQARFVVHNYADERYVEAERLLRKVIEVEPEFVPAIWELARLVSRKSNGTDNEGERDEISKELNALIARMVEIAPTSSYANGWLANVARFQERDYQKAAHHYEMAVAGGTDWNAWFQLGRGVNFLLFLGRGEEAAAISEIMLRRDPACFNCIFGVARGLRDAGKHLEAAALLESIVEWHGHSFYTDWNLGVAWLVAGEFEKARLSFDRLGGGQREFGLMLALASAGPAGEFERALAEYIKENQGNQEGIARIYAWSGQNDLAFEWLEKAVEQFGADIANDVKTDLYEPIKSDPRWQQFLEKYGSPVEDLSHIVFNLKPPPADWVAVGARPATNP